MALHFTNSYQFDLNWQEYTRKKEENRIAWQIGGRVVSGIRCLSVCVAVLAAGLLASTPVLAQEESSDPPGSQELPASPVAGKGAKLLQALQENTEAIAKALENKDPDALKKAADGISLALAKFNEAPTSDEINRLAAYLSGQLGNYKGGAGDVQSTLGVLEDAIAELNGKGSPEFAETEAEKLKSTLAVTSWTRGGAVTNLLSLSPAILRETRFVDPDGTATALRSATGIVLNQPDSGFRPPFERLDFLNAIDATETTLDGRLREADPVGWFTQTATALEDVFVEKTRDDKAAKDLKAGRRRLVQNSPEAMAAAAKVKATVEALTDGYRPKIHVITAYYGDLRLGRYSKRVCDASRSMIARCERQDSCTLPASYQTALCGFDPIPAADKYTQAVGVTYSCHSGGDALWDELAHDPHSDPDTGSDLLDGANPAVHYAILRGEVMDIRCPANGGIAERK